MTEKVFVNGLSVKTVNTQYGDIIKCGINVDNIINNPINNGYINFDIKKGKEGNWYAEINNYKKEG